MKGPDNGEPDNDNMEGPDNGDMEGPDNADLIDQAMGT